MAEPPVGGAVQLIVAWALPATAVTTVGTAGGVFQARVSLRKVAPLSPPKRASLPETPL